MILSKTGNYAIGISLFLLLLTIGTEIFVWATYAHPWGFITFLPIWFILWMISFYVIHWVIGKLLKLIFSNIVA